MVVSEQLDKFFDEKMKNYPIRRSFLVPMLLYTQDELGYLSGEAIAYIAQKVGLTELEVRNVISYYSMLTTKPRGKFNVQVCTNISCMLRGAEEIWITSSTKEVLAVTTLDGRPVGAGTPGAIFRAVHGLYQDFKRKIMRQAA